MPKFIFRVICQSGSGEFEEEFFTDEVFKDYFVKCFMQQHEVCEIKQEKISINRSFYNYESK